MHTGPIDGLHAGVQSRLGSCPQRTNERMTSLWKSTVICSLSFDTVGWVIWPAKTVPEMTYNVFSGTLDPTHLLTYAVAWANIRPSRLSETNHLNIPQSSERRS